MFLLHRTSRARVCFVRFVSEAHLSFPVAYKSIVLHVIAELSNASEGKYVLCVSLPRRKSCLPLSWVLSLPLTQIFVSLPHPFEACHSCRRCWSTQQTPLLPLPHLKDVLQAIFEYFMFFRPLFWAFFQGHLFLSFINTSSFAGSTHDWWIHPAGTSCISGLLCWMSTDCSLQQDVLFLLFCPWQAFNSHASKLLFLPSLRVAPGTIWPTFSRHLSPRGAQRHPCSQMNVSWWFSKLSAPSACPSSCSPGHFSPLRPGFVLHLHLLPFLQLLFFLEIST